jgi:uncharacterized protein (TIGR00369 family)
MNDDDLVPEPPPGFVRLDRRGEFTLRNGPLFERLPDHDHACIEHAIFILPRHANGLGVLHGGMLATFLDGLLGGAARRGSGRVGVTVHLSVDFLRMARKGEWLMGEGRMTRCTRDLAFAEGRAYIGDAEVGRASGIFKLMGR